MGSNPLWMRYDYPMSHKWPWNSWKAYFLIIKKVRKRVTKGWVSCTLYSTVQLSRRGRKRGKRLVWRWIRSSRELLSIVFLKVGRMIGVLWKVFSIKNSFHVQEKQQLKRLFKLFFSESRPPRLLINKPMTFHFWRWRSNQLSFFYCTILPHPP